MQKQRNATIPHKQATNSTHNMIQSQAALTASVKSQSSHCSAARATLQNAGRLHYRPEASQNHLNNYTCIHKLAAQRITRTRCAHNSASPFARARSPASHCGRKRSGRHIPAQANYKQHSQHDTIASGTHRERVISAKVQQLTRVRLAPRCKPQAGKVSDQKHHKIT